MKPTNIILVRHGESEANINNDILKEKPDYAVELTEDGSKQAFELGKELSQKFGKLAAFYVSPFWRTRQTYCEIVKSFIYTQPYEDPRLREQERGKDSCNWHSKLARDNFGQYYYRFDGGESCADVDDRISSFLNTLFRDFEREWYPNNVIIVTHGLAMRCFLRRFFKWSVEDFELLKNPKNCEYFHLSCLDRVVDCKYTLLSDLEKYDKHSHPYQFKWPLA